MTFWKIQELHSAVLSCVRKWLHENALQYYLLLRSRFPPSYQCQVAVYAEDTMRGSSIIHPIDPSPTITTFEAFATDGLFASKDEILNLDSTHWAIVFLHFLLLRSRSPPSHPCLVAVYAGDTLRGMSTLQTIDLSTTMTTLEAFATDGLFANKDAEILNLDSTLWAIIGAFIA